MTDADYLAWLANPASVKVVLVEVGVLSGGVEITRYLATRGYITSPTDTPSNQEYNPIVSTAIKFTESLSLSSNVGSLSSGDLELNNLDGSIDTWLDDVWDNRPIKAWIGDPMWVRSDFRMIFNGIVATIGSSSRDSLNLSIVDKLQQLNNPITDQKLGGTTSNKGSLIPLTFGEGHNITPLSIDPALLKYQVHNGPVEDIFEVRDNGLPVGFTKDNSTGTFTLNQNPVGDVTASVQGDKSGVYNETIASIVRRIVTGFGLSDTRFTDVDLDLDNLNAFDAAHQYWVGDYLPSGENVLSVINGFANSIGAQVVMSRLGKLRLIQIDVPGTGTPVVVDGSYMVEKSLSIADRPYVSGSIMIGCNKNYTVQESLLVGTGLPAEARALFISDWFKETATDTTVKAKYKLNAAPTQIDTLLVDRDQAQLEAQRRLNLWKVPRTVFSFEGTAELLGMLELGQAITLVNRRFGLENGKTGMVMSLSPDWMTGRVDVEVLI